MSKVGFLYLIFSASIVIILYAASIVFPSVLFIYPRSFGGEFANKLFSISLLTLFTVLCIAFLVVIIRMDKKYVASRVSNDNLFQSTTLFLCVLFSFVPLFVAYLILLRFPSSSDEFVFLFQAQIFSDGAFFVDAPPVPEIFTTTWMVEHNSKWAGMYPPGWPAIITLGSVLGLPDWTVNPLLGIISVVLVYYLCSLQYCRSTSLASSLIYASSIYVIFNASSFFSHISFVVAVLSYAIFVVIFSKTQQGRYLIGAGVALSAALVIRYYPAVLMGIPLVFYLYKWRALSKGVGFLVLGGLPLTVVLALYHAIVFGSPLTTGYSLQPGHLGGTHLRIDILEGVHNVLIRLWELGGWGSPVLALMYLVAITYRIRSRSLSLTDTLFPVLVFGLLLFPDPGGNRYGPRYFFDAFPFFVICSVAGVFDYVRDKSEAVKNGARHAVMMTVIYSLCLLPFAMAFFHKVAWERSELDRLIEAKGLENAIVVVRSGIGRLLPFADQDLIKNDPYLTNDVLFVRPVDEQVLTALFPSRAIWVYERMQREAPAGDLVRLK